MFTHQQLVFNRYHFTMFVNEYSCGTPDHPEWRQTDWHEALDREDARQTVDKWIAYWTEQGYELDAHDTDFEHVELVDPHTGYKRTILIEDTCRTASHAWAPRAAQYASALTGVR